MKTMEAFHKKEQKLTARQYIIDTYGLNWLSASWDSGDVIDALEGYSVKQTEELQEAYNENAETLLELTHEKIDAAQKLLKRAVEILDKYKSV